MADLILGSTTAISESGGTVALGTGVTMANATFPAGHVLQVKHGFCKREVAGSGMTPSLIHADLEIDITPSNASNEIIIFATVHMTSTYNKHSGVLLYKDDSELTGSTSTGEPNQIKYFLTTGYNSAFNAQSHMELQQYSLSGTYKDIAGSSGSPITYSLYARDRAGNGWYINRTKTNGSDDSNSASTSSIMLMEVKA